VASDGAGFIETVLVGVVGALLVEGPDGDTRTKMARQVAAVATAPVSVARTGFMTVTQLLILVTSVRVS
jgi:uncharacterized membrane protein YeaQ/YmgE (transglycosylase-associated protein family)